MAPSPLQPAVLSGGLEVALVLLSAVVIIGIPLALCYAFMVGVADTAASRENAVRDIERQLDHLDYGRNP